MLDNPLIFFFQHKNKIILALPNENKEQRNKILVYIIKLRN